MDILADQTLIRADGSSVSANDALKDKSILLFYFSAHWCPPCRKFTPVLKEFYEEVVKNGQLEVIFISSDQSKEDMISYMNESHGNWLAVEHESETARKLESKLDVSGIPYLVVCRKDGSVITTNGRGEVQDNGPAAVQGWK